ncbi:His/Glu/Gln/Arg/opine family amino acid ABC transporter permease subunit [Lelliottia sp. 489]
MSDLFRDVSPEDADLQPIIDGLFGEYAARYGDYFSKDAEIELTEWYLPPQGLFIVLERDGEIIATGAYKPFDAHTAEIKRIWTNKTLRQQGLAARVVQELERRAVLAGYSGIYLTTGFRQPEAVRLYLSQGYAPQFDLDRDPEEYSQPPFDGRLRFTKTLVSEAFSKSALGTTMNNNVETIKVVPARYPWRTVGAIAALFVLAVVVQSVAFNPRWEWGVFARWFFDPVILEGVGQTLLLTLIGTALSVVLGGMLALARLSSSWLLSTLAFGYIWLFRSLPLIVVLIILYNFSYLYDTLSLGVPFTQITWGKFETINVLGQFSTAVVGLTLVQSAYTAEIIRGGFLGVDHGQYEAAAALGLPAWRRTVRIILPQALRTILPSGFNEIISLAKGTAMVYVLAMPELFYTIQMIYNRTQEVIPLLMVGAAWYLVITTVLSVIQHVVERGLARSERRSAVNQSRASQRTRSVTPSQEPIHASLS